ncbi:MAG: hypothetical protein HEQ21_00200 [Blastomonas sp.]|jgi:hypothetical protein|uniref:hypothetical protein n=1 Tax=Blastomonas TaxID=150203 RepID=UPI0006B99C3C|nr:MULTISPECIES: hypothetical protein [Blastomonas]AOF99283.1 hypothetical protein BSY18_3232 [Blastomonas sp. RAC04]KPF71992.1 hypothetical protein IP68_18300 [Blastomonas sp. AAP25]MCO5791221.1 hypothetical protein [Blastomonas sp.]MDM7967053.1 hypothetical protein [Blastomonas fulva]
MTDHQDPKPAANDPVDCTEETAQRAGAKHSSLNTDEHDAKPDVDKDDISEKDLDDALDDSMDASDPPSSIQP